MKLTHLFHTRAYSFHLVLICWYAFTNNIIYRFLNIINSYMYKCINVITINM